MRLFPAIVLLMLAPACGDGLAPPQDARPGAIHGVVRYEGTWPPPDSLFDLRFVAMRFVPQDTADFLNLNALVFNDPRLAYHVSRDTFFIPNVEPGLFPYSGVAQKFGAGLTRWRPVGLYEADGGVFRVRAAETTFVEVRVDFQHPPPFPPR